jgi:predicted DCC family thiol-disulfide oxidoreductase YuxK
MSQPSTSPSPSSSEKRTSEPVGVAAVLREFATADPRSLGLFRIVFSVFLLVDLYRRLPDYVFFYTNEGMLPNHGAIYRPMSGFLFSVYHALSTRGEVMAGFALTAIVYVLYGLGWKTRVMQALVLVLATSLHSRNIMLENGGDVVCNILALWTFFLPLGRRFSLDALLASLRETDEHNTAELNDRSRPYVDRRPFVSLAMAAIVLNVAFIYCFNTLHKDGITWRLGTSTHYVFWADRLVQPLGVLARQWLPPIAFRVMTIGTLVIESSIFILLLSPIWIRSCRRVAALMIIALHCGFQTVGHFGLFSFVMMLHSILLLGPEDWDALARRMRARLPSRVVFYDAACGVCHQLTRLAKRADHLAKLRFVANDEPEKLPPGITPETVLETVVVSDASGARSWKYNDAVTQGLRALPFGVLPARLLELPGIHALGRLGYEAIASRRQAISEALGYAACGLPQKFGGEGERPAALRPAFTGRLFPVLREATLALFIVALGSQMLAENRKVPQQLCLAWGGEKHCLPWNLKRQPEPLAALAQYPRFFQGWSMFAPVPPMDDGKVVVDAVTIDGRHIDPLAGGLPVDFSLPPANQGMLMTQFWYEFHDRIRREANARYRQHFQDWLVNWNLITRRPASDRIVEFEAYWVWRPTQLPFKRTREEVRKQKFMEWKAPGGTPTPRADSAPPRIRVPAVVP